MGNSCCSAEVLNTMEVNCQGRPMESQPTEELLPIEESKEDYTSPVAHDLEHSKMIEVVEVIEEQENESQSRHQIESENKDEQNRVPVVEETPYGTLFDQIRKDCLQGDKFEEAILPF